MKSNENVHFSAKNDNITFTIPQNLIKSQEKNVPVLSPMFSQHHFTPCFVSSATMLDPKQMFEVMEMSLEESFP